LGSDKEKLLPVTPTTEGYADKDAQRKKYIKIGLIVLGVVAVILAIVLPLTLRKKPDNPPRPDPIGPNPLPPGIMNPYKTV